MKIRWRFYGIIVLGLVSGCDDPDGFDCLKTTGSWTQETRSISLFSKLIVEDNIDVVLRDDTLPEAVVEAGKNLISKIRFERTGDTLRLFNANACNWARSYKTPVRVTIGKSRINTISHEGFGRISSSEKLHLRSLLYLLVLEANGNVDLDVDAGEVVLYSNCAPDFRIRGKANSFYAWFRDVGKLSAEGLQAQHCEVRNAGANVMRVFPVQRLVAHIEASGNIEYYNQPVEIESHVSGTGKLLPK